MKRLDVIFSYGMRLYGQGSSRAIGSQGATQLSVKLTYLNKLIEICFEPIMSALGWHKHVVTRLR
jgi:hypothetical protein